jgi:hypothetical protein
MCSPQFEVESVSNTHHRYNPGDVALIHPAIAPDEVEEFLTARGWGNIADEPLSIAQVATGRIYHQTLEALRMHSQIKHSLLTFRRRPPSVGYLLTV